MNATTSNQIKIRACFIICIAHPEWGKWGVMDTEGDDFVIRNSRGSRLLSKDEADRFWAIAE